MKPQIIAAVLSSLIGISSAYASHDMVMPPVEQSPADSHISWHEFRHDLGSFPGVVASIDHHGVITLAGHTDSSDEKRKIDGLAAKVRGATEVINLIGAD